MIVVIFRNEAFNLSIPAVVELKEGEQFLKSGGVKGAKLIRLVSCIYLSNWVLSELVVEIYVPAQ